MDAITVEILTGLREFLAIQIVDLAEPPWAEVSSIRSAVNRDCLRTGNVQFHQLDLLLLQIKIGETGGVAVGQRRTGRIS
jgi:hypothetical protein